MITIKNIQLLGHIPFLFEIDDADAWDDTDAPLKIHEIIVGLNKAGYEGVSFIYSLTNTSRVFYAPLFDLNTHEGILLANLIQTAKNGDELPILQECINQLTQLYADKGTNND